jgi:hypothetical protein
MEWFREDTGHPGRPPADLHRQNGGLPPGNPVPAYPIRFDSSSRIDEHQTVARFKDQAVTDQAPALAQAAATIMASNLLVHAPAPSFA